MMAKIPRSVLRIEPAAPMHKRSMAQARKRLIGPAIN
jgi:hypothetical protein